MVNYKVGDVVWYYEAFEQRTGVGIVRKINEYDQIYVTGCIVYLGALSDKIVVIGDNPLVFALFGVE